MAPDALRIAITHTRFSYTGGIEKYIYSLVEHLLKEGHEVHYLTHRWEKHLHPRLHFHRVPRVRFPGSLKVKSFNRNVNKILDRESFDLVHGFTKTDRQDIYTDGSGCLDDFVAATLAHRPLWWRRLYLATPHQKAIHELEERRYQPGAIRRIIPMANFVRDQILKRYSVDPDCIEVVYNGVEIEHFHPRHRDTLGAEFRQRHGIAAETPVLLFVGNDFQRKGVDTIIRALPEMVSAIKPPPLLVVAGRDNHAGRYRRMAARHGVLRHTLWLGPVREVRELFAAADVFLFPSHYDVFGNVGLEALASGVPAVLSSRAGVSEVLDGGPSGHRLEDPTDADELARHTRFLLLPEKREMRCKGARAIAERYSWDVHFHRILEIYQEVLEEKRTAKQVMTTT